MTGKQILSVTRQKADSAKIDLDVPKVNTK